MKRVNLLILLAATTMFLKACTGTQEPTIEKAQSNTLPKVSVQLWSVRDAVKTDIDGTLEKLAAMGFQGVEFANEFGPYKNNPAGLKAKLDSLGLAGSGAHVSFEQLNADNLMATIAFYATLDVSMLIIPYDPRAWSSTEITNIVEELNARSAQLAKYGMKVGYHNHAEEFRDFEDSTYWDFLAQNTNDHVVLQLDVGWAEYAGKEPAEYVRRYPGRTNTTHYKVKLPEGTQGKLPLIGQDTIDWNKLLRANVEVGGTQWVVVEQEEYPNNLTPLEAVEISMSGLQEVIKQFK